MTNWITGAVSLTTEETEDSAFLCAEVRLESGASIHKCVFVDCVFAIDSQAQDIYIDDSTRFLTENNEHQPQVVALVLESRVEDTYYFKKITEAEYVARLALCDRLCKLEQERINLRQALACIPEEHRAWVSQVLIQQFT